jgi:hypothetical protein
MGFIIPWSPEITTVFFAKAGVFCGPVRFRIGFPDIAALCRTSFVAFGATFPRGEGFWCDGDL